MGIIQVRATSILQFFPFFNSDSEDFSRKMANWAKHLAAGSECPVFAKDKLTFLNMRFCPYAQRTQLVLDAKKIP